MATPGIPSNLFLQQGNLTVALQWNLVAGATSYDVQRSADGVTFASVGTPTVNNYTDTTPATGTMYWYQVAAVNSSGTSPYTSAQQIVVAPNGELSLYELRQRAQQRADRVNSDFVKLPEWNFFIMQAMYELYDLLIDVYEDYFCAPEVYFNTNGSDYLYDLPNGVATYTDSATGQSVVAPPFYKLSGIDLGLNSANNAYVTLNKYNLIDRNRFVYPNTSSTIYGVFNLQYRLMGNKIRFIPTPSANQPIRLLYIPKLPQMIKDTDLTTIGGSGWLQYVIARAAKYALDKEESDTSSLDQEILYLKGRIEESAVNRDAGQPDRISDTRQAAGAYNSNWPNGSFGGN